MWCCGIVFIYFEFFCFFFCFLFQYFLAVCVLVKPLNKETQRVALAAHLTSLEVTLSGFFCPKLREVLPLECAALKSFRRLLFLEGVSHFGFSARSSGQPSSSALHHEVGSVLQSLHSHLVLLHLLARLPNSVPGISDFLGQSRFSIDSPLLLYYTHIHAKLFMCDITIDVPMTLYRCPHENMFNVPI